MKEKLIRKRIELILDHDQEGILENVNIRSDISPEKMLEVLGLVVENLISAIPEEMINAMDVDIQEILEVIKSSQK
ncbi:hypothetical protein [Persicobacter diffluens]|uniref:Uncharacterized protein n=1 Tax=Persicobacter diffluens TaxID=981 RepID=A0AAN4W2M0_9BACT|nr:hypothetical protein PEDI_40350 [Persicobacter diffluens]